MKTITLIVQMLVRLIGLVLIILGFMFWTHHSYNLIPLHMRLGITLAVLLAILALLAFAARVKPVLAIVALAWAVLVVAFGYNMGNMLPGKAHEAIRVLHFFIGLGAIGLAEMLGGRIKRKGQPVVSDLRVYISTS